MTVLAATRGSPASSEIRNNLALTLAGTAIREDLETVLTNIDNNVADSLAQHTYIIHSDAQVTFTGTALTYTSAIELRLIHNTTGSTILYTIPVGQTLTLSADSKIIYAVLARDGSGTGTVPSTDLTTSNGNLVVDASSIPALVKSNIWYLPLGIRIDTGSDQIFHWFGGNGAWLSGTQKYIGVAGTYLSSVSTDSTLTGNGTSGNPLSVNVSGYTDPMTTRGDTLYRNASNVTARLPVGTTGQVKVTDGTDVSWSKIADANVSATAAIAESKLNLAYTTTTLNGSIGTVSGDLSTHTGSTAAHGATGANVGTTNSQTLENKSLLDTTTFIVDASDPTKKIGFDAGGTASTKTTITSAQTVDRVLTLPDETDTLSSQTNAKNQAIKYALVLG